jgi:hypothetical protein
VERSITQATAGAPEGAAEAVEEAAEAEEAIRINWAPLAWGVAIVLLCLTVYVRIHPEHFNSYVHFAWQAQAWLDGETSIPTGQHATDQSPDNSYYQDVQPIVDADGAPTGRGIIPFPPLPALVLVPFVAVWHLFTDEQTLAAIFGALDVGLAYWMLGYLRIPPSIRRLTALFFGLGTALFYTSVIGTTWFWAHIVALGCLLLSVGFALSADAMAEKPQEDALRHAVRLPRWSGGWYSAACLVSLGALSASLLPLTGAGAPAWAVAVVGLLAACAAAALAVTVSGRKTVVLPYAVVATVVVGIPGAFLLQAWAPEPHRILSLVLALVAAVLAVASWTGSERLDAMLAAAARALSRPEARQVAAGLLFGLACTARLTILFGFPFLLLVGGGRCWRCSSTPMPAPATSSTRPTSTCTAWSWDTPSTTTPIGPSRTSATSRRTWSSSCSTGRS